jgi:hypothetical protein
MFQKELGAFLGLLGAGVVILSFAMCVSRPKPGCQEDVVIEQAWADALRIAGAKPGDVSRPRNVRIVYEARYYPGGPFVVFRTCGRTDIYVTKDAAKKWLPPSYDIQVFIAPGDCKMLRLALIHEFLHVIGSEVKEIPLGDSEAWVREVFNETCH